MNKKDNKKDRSKSKLVKLTLQLEVIGPWLASDTACCLDDLAPLIDMIEALSMQSKTQFAANPVHSLAVVWLLKRTQMRNYTWNVATNEEMYLECSNQWGNVLGT